MSSHHIVREKQEPALLVLGLNNFTNELLGQLLEWSPTIITTPKTAEVLSTNGVKIDWIISNGDNGIMQSNVKMMSTGSDHLTDAALEFLIDNEYSAVNIVSDDFNAADYEHFTDQINLVVFHNNKKIYAVTPGFSKWKPAGETIELLGPANTIHFKGLTHVAHPQYKTSEDGFFSLHFEEPFLFISEEI
jgi:thiamine pyrophosphokinase